MNVKVMRKKGGKCKRQNRMRNRFGFTIIELTLAIVISGVIFVGIGFSVESIIQFWTRQAFHNAFGFEAESAMFRMIREIRQVRNLESVTTATQTNFVFTDVTNQAIDYDYDDNANQLTRNNALILENVASFQFQYWDEDYNALGAPATSPLETDIRQVCVSMTVSQGADSVELRSCATPRNLDD